MREPTIHAGSRQGSGAAHQKSTSTREQKGTNLRLAGRLFVVAAFVPGAAVRNLKLKASRGFEGGGEGVEYQDKKITGTTALTQTR